VFAESPPDQTAEAIGSSSLVVGLASRVSLPGACTVRPCAWRRSARRTSFSCGSPMGFCGLPAYEATGSDQCRACLTRLRSTFGFSQPLGALLRPKPSRPCFVPVTLIGFFTFRGFPPPVADLASRRSLPSLPFPRPRTDARGSEGSEHPVDPFAAAGVSRCSAGRSSPGVPSPRYLPMGLGSVLPRSLLSWAST